MRLLEPRGTSEILPPNCKSDGRERDSTRQVNEFKFPSPSQRQAPLTDRNFIEPMEIEDYVMLIIICPRLFGSRPSIQTIHVLPAGASRITNTALPRKPGTTWKCDHRDSS